MLSAICFNLDQSKILSPSNGLTVLWSGKGLTLYKTTDDLWHRKIFNL